MVYIFLADGFEEIEALTQVDYLRRAGIEVKTVGVTGKTVHGAHGISVLSDITEKDVVLTLAPQQKLRRVLPDLSSHLHLAKAGHGIAFAIELDSINASALNSLTRFMSEDAIKEEAPMNKEYTHEVILSVLDSDQTDLAFAAAKEAGCRGGTVIKGRRISGGETKKIFSLTVQPEKELLMILVPAKDCKAIMKAMVNKVQQETGERIVAFSLPVSDVMGLTHYDLMNDNESEA